MGGWVGGGVVEGGRGKWKEGGGRKEGEVEGGGEGGRGKGNEGGERREGEG